MCQAREVHFLSVVTAMEVEPPIKFPRFAALLTEDIPSSIQQLLCGETPLPSNESLQSRKQDRPKKKGKKSQRRVEKEKEWHERQQRLQENQKAKALAKKKVKCRFFLKGMCKEGDKCAFGHDYS